MSDETRKEQLQQAKSELEEAVEQYFLSNDKSDLRSALLQLAAKVDIELKNRIENLEKFQSEFK